jgi:hypothetical protein
VKDNWMIVAALVFAFVVFTVSVIRDNGGLRRGGRR